MPVRGTNGTYSSITTAPFNIQFSNKNDVMKLRGHSHYAKVVLEYETLGEVGFPVFEETISDIQTYLKEITKKPFINATNEDVAKEIAHKMEMFKGQSFDNWGGDYKLKRIFIYAMGVPDEVGIDRPISHSSGFAIYRVDLY